MAAALNTSANYTDTDTGYYSFSDVEIWISSIFYILLIVASVVGNLLIMCVVYSNKRMRTITHYFIINNAVADLLITAFGIPMAAREQIIGTDTITFGGFWGLSFCRTLVYTQDISCCSSIFTLVAIATDRFCATFFPFKRLITMDLVKWIVLIIWVTSFILPLPLFFIVQLALDPYNNEYYCRENWSVFSSLGTETQLEGAYTIFIFVTWYAAPLVIISILYGTIINTVWKRTIPGQESATSQRIQSRTKKKVLKMLITVVICFAVCWLPYHVMFFVYNEDPPPLNLWLFGNFMRYANSGITPWIYVIFSKDYRKGVRDILLRWMCKRPVLHTSFRSSSSNLSREPSMPTNVTIALETYTNTNMDEEE